MKKLFNIYIGLATALFVVSCAPEHDSIEIKQSSADFTKFISIGNSLTAGFADGGLYLAGQQAAFPNLIAEQMQHVGGGTFTSPFFSADQANGSGYIRIQALQNGLPVTENVTNDLAIRGLNPEGNPLYTKHSGEINNYGVPGMRLDMAFVQEGIGSVMGNPYFERLLGDNDDPMATSYLDFTTDRGHTFFSFWLGNNDALGFATAGGVENDATSTLTESALFTQLLTAYINALTAGDRKGVIANIPDVTAVPFLTTVTQPQLAAAVTQASDGEATNVFIATKQGPRPATPEDLFVLTFPTTLLGQPNEQGIPYGFHPLNPIADQYVLDSDEVARVRQRVNQFNSAIRRVADDKGLAFVDIHTFMNKVKQGMVYNGVPLSSEFITGNAFSLDGIHLTPIGNAVVANLFIEAINRKYNASIPRVDVSNYSGVRLPN